MSFPRYISAVNAALRDIVLPEAQTSRARDAIESCTRVLAAIAVELDADTLLSAKVFNKKTLPPGLPSPSAKEHASTEGLVLPTIHPVHDVVVNALTFPLVRDGAAWLAANGWEQDSEQKATACALIEGDQTLRSDVVSSMRGIERGFQSAKAHPGSAEDISRSALEAYLRDWLRANDFSITDFRFVSGRGSRQTALFSTNQAGGFPLTAVIQRDDPRNVFPFTVVQQYPLLEALFPARLRVPRPVLLEVSRDVLGAPFMIVESLPGAPPVDGMNYFDPPPKMPTLALGLATQLALLHKVPVAGLATILPHSVDRSKGERWVDVINRYEALWNSMAHHPSIAVTAAFSWMRQHVGCAQDIETFVHADALLHNLLAIGEEITGLLDWELAHIGHPAEDLGYLKPVVEQMVEWEDFMEAYYAAGGRHVTSEQISFFTLLPLLKLITQGLQAGAAFENGQSNELTLAECSASFVPKLVDRLGLQLVSILKSK